MIVDVVTDVLKQRWGSPSEISPNVWLSIEERSLSGQCENDRAVWVSGCPGGSYHFFARISIRESGVSFNVRTVYGIIMRRFNNSEEFFFEYCDPGFPENFFEFVRRAATNALKCYKLEHARSCNNRRRRERQAISR